MIWTAARAGFAATGSLLLGCGLLSGTLRGASGGAVASGAGGRSPTGTRSIVAERAGGTVVAARPVPSDGSFALFYVHSAYLAPTAELFTSAGGRFTMHGIASPNEAVLDYYEAEGGRSRVSGWWVLRLDRPQTFDELPLIATPVGRRTLVTGAACLPLFPRSGAYDLRIRVRPARPAGRTEPCPPAVLEVLREAEAPAAVR